MGKEVYLILSCALIPVKNKCAKFVSVTPKVSATPLCLKTVDLLIVLSLLLICCSMPKIFGVSYTGLTGNGVRSLLHTLAHAFSSQGVQ